MWWPPRSPQPNSHQPTRKTNPGSPTEPPDSRQKETIFHMMRRGRPGMMGMMARTAVVAGTATAVSHGVSNKMNSKEQAAADAQQQQTTEQQQEAAQQQQLAEQQQQIADLEAQQKAAPAAPADGGDELIAQLEKLGSLRDSGVLSPEEFAAAKAKLLGS
jgi:microsomal dipeptidase-like Zn-dependent dipeptidase